MKRRIPAHIGWPLLVIFLLLSGMVTSLSVVFFARSDGGVQLVEDSNPGAPAEQKSQR